MADDFAIKVENVSKSFKLPHEKQATLKSALINFNRRGYEKQEVLKNISFEVKKGEFFGIVGRNGSGKSTLLKILSGIYTPDEGQVHVRGKLTPFIELGVGFNHELTGRENVFLNGALLGFSRKQMDAMYDDIVEFAELERFMDQKLKNYSSGMQVRLAFSIAIRAESDVLILDEVLAVGDEAFQRKCEDYFRLLKKNKKTVILVTHSMENVRRYCNRAMVIKEGAISVEGGPEAVADEYYEMNLVKTSKDNKSKNKNLRLSAEIDGSHILTPKETLRIKIKYKSSASQPVYPKAYVDLNGQALMATNPRLLNWKRFKTADDKQHVVMYKVPLDRFNKGEFRVICLLEDAKTNANIISYGYEGELTFKIQSQNKSSSGGVMQNTATLEAIE